MYIFPKKNSHTYLHTRVGGVLKQVLQEKCVRSLDIGIPLH